METIYIKQRDRDKVGGNESYLNLVGRNGFYYHSASGLSVIDLGAYRITV